MDNSNTPSGLTMQTDDLPSVVSAALSHAWGLGQTYWQQADSDSYLQNKKSDDTRARFCKLKEESTAHAAALQAENDKLRADAARWRWIEENAHSTGGGQGFTLSVFVPHDMEDLGCAIDAARASITGDKG